MTLSVANTHHSPRTQPLGRTKIQRPEKLGYRRSAMQAKGVIAWGASADYGAGEGNRTLVVSLGSFCSTIELHPRAPDGNGLVIGAGGEADKGVGRWEIPGSSPGMTVEGGGGDDEWGGGWMRLCPLTPTLSREGTVA